MLRLVMRLVLVVVMPVCGVCVCGVSALARRLSSCEIEALLSSLGDEGTSGELGHHTHTPS